MWTVHLISAIILSGVDAQKVGADAANELLRNIDEGGCVDDYLQDQVNSASVYCTGWSKKALFWTTLYM